MEGMPNSRLWLHLGRQRPTRRPAEWWYCSCPSTHTLSALRSAYTLDGARPCLTTTKLLQQKGTFLAIAIRREDRSEQYSLRPRKDI